MFLYTWLQQDSLFLTAGTLGTFAVEAKLSNEEPLRELQPHFPGGPGGPLTPFVPTMYSPIIENTQK